MLRKYIAKFILSQIGWETVSIKEKPKSSIICIAPHTSNWDFILGKLYAWRKNISSYFLIKQEWFVFPFNIIFSAMGGIPVNRGKKNSTVAKICSLIENGKNIHIAITPEGTRKSSSQWHKGFYYIALEANLPIEIAVLDYKNKKVGVVDIIYPSGDVEKDMEKIKRHYNSTQAYHPNKFSK